MFQAAIVVPEYCVIKYVVSLEIWSTMKALRLRILTKGTTLEFLYFPSKGQLEQVQLSAPSVVIKNKAVNLTTVLQPSDVGTVTYYWWFDNKTEVSHTFSY